MWVGDLLQDAEALDSRGEPVLFDAAAQVLHGDIVPGQVNLGW